MSDRLRVGIVGASGYGGGELLRILLRHPRAEVVLATSDRFAGKRLRAAHPNLRASEIEFQPHAAALTAGPLDALFLAGPHGTSAPKMRHYLKTASRVFDLAADFRLANPADYATYYEGWQHPEPDLLAQRAYGIAELHRDRIRSAALVSGAGCIATSAILALAPLARRGLIEDRVVVDAKIGSSAAGAEHSPGTHHPERSGVVRAYAPAGHRHEAEIRQETGLGEVGLSCHAVELVRGILSTCHVWLRDDLDEKAVWKVYREAYGAEPFVRIVKERTGLFRLPEPKLVAGTNECHVGFERDPRSRRLVVVSAIDNLVRGTAGAAVQNLNVAYGLPETTGLEFTALHP